MKKYICIGGYIYSKNDNDRHYVSPEKLTWLYKVNPLECYFVKDDTSQTLFGLDLDKLTILRPDYEGIYELPKMIKEKK